jgi:UDP-glucose 4-epimerase
MNILVIGSRGFIGSHLVRYFREKGNRVYGCDVIVEYNDSEYFLIDATSDSFEEIFSTVDFEFCVNASGASSVPDSFVHPFRDYHLNTKNVYTVLEAIRRLQPGCKFLNLSSAAVYGNPVSLPIDEAAEIRPLSPYGFHKHYAEQICKEHFRFFGTATCSVRIFSAYGPGLRKQLFWDWHQKVKNASEITLFGTGTESRDFIFIDDIAYAIECVLLNSPFESEVINIANGEEIRIAEAIETFRMALRSNFDYRFNNEVRMGDPLNWRADITALRKLGYQRRFGFREGIEKYAQWLNQME